MKTFIIVFAIILILIISIYFIVGNYFYNIALSSNDKFIQENL